MKFTLVFPTHESTDLSLAALFVPCLVWHEGNRAISNPHPDNPHYLTGDLQKVLELVEIKNRISKDSNKVTIVCHAVGNGTEEDLKGIQADASDLGFEPQVVRH
jgi:enoyl-[acyl-carrier-protein] reductase (NADH)